MFHNVDNIYPDFANYNLTLPSKSSGARYQNVTTTGSSSARGFRGALKSLAKPMSVILRRPFSGPEDQRDRYFITFNLRYFDINFTNFG